MDGSNWEFHSSSQIQTSLVIYSFSSSITICKCYWTWDKTCNNSNSTSCDKETTSCDSKRARRTERGSCETEEVWCKFLSLTLSEFVLFIVCLRLMTFFMCSRCFSDYKALLSVDETKMWSWCLLFGIRFFCRWLDCRMFKWSVSGFSLTISILILSILLCIPEWPISLSEACIWIHDIWVEFGSNSTCLDGTLFY